MQQSASTFASAMTATRARPASLDWSDDWGDPKDVAGYCPMQLLGSFTLLMAGHGRCVSSSMMLGDREYAMWQLARAHAMADEALRAVAVRLFTYFDDPRGWGAAMQQA
jgi:hypothetical protein